jgi:hypothetical protein
MNVFKITNTTDLLNKRDFYYNTSLKIEYADGMRKKIVSIDPGKTIFLKINHMPISIHKLRSKGLITVVETDEEMPTAQISEKKVAVSSKNKVKTGGNVGGQIQKKDPKNQKRKTTITRKSTPKTTESDSEEKKD